MLFLVDTPGSLLSVIGLVPKDCPRKSTHDFSILDLVLLGLHPRLFSVIPPCMCRLNVFGPVASLLVIVNIAS